MRIGYRGKVALLVAGQVLVLVLVAVFTYQPSVAAIDDAEQKLNELSARQAELCNELERFPHPESDIAAAKAEIQQMENRMPSESRVSWLSARIAEAMHKHQIDLRSASDWSEGGRVSPVPELKRLQKLVTVCSTAENLEAFLESINKLPFVVIVEDVDVTRDEKWGSVLANVRLATFVLRAAPPAAQTPKTAPESRSL